MAKRQFTCIFIISFLLLSCIRDNKDSLDNQLLQAVSRSSKTGRFDFFVMPESKDFDKLPNQDPHNPITLDKVELGQKLFFETGLAQVPLKDESYETYSCSSCHVPNRGFLPGRIQGIADGGLGFGENGSYRTMRPTYVESEIDAQGVRPMTVMNVTYVTNTLWSGTFGANDQNEGTQESWTGLAEVNHTGYAGLEAQNIEGFDLHRLAINDRVLYDYGYDELFDEAFPDVSQSDRYTPETASFAIGAYLRTILTNQTPFQEFLRGDRKAMTINQKLGGLVFFGKAGCSSCHNSPSLSSMNFYSLGTRDMHEIGGLNTSPSDSRNLGRGMFTGIESDMYKFKVPQLYNLKDYVSFFHGSSKSSIEAVVDFKLTAKSENPNVSNEMVAITPRQLTQKERSDLIDFLTYALYDYDMERYAPESVLSGNCFPNNDIVSKLDMDCD